MNIVLASLWRLDVGRQITERVNHLLEKKCDDHKLRWLFVVGDSDDFTVEKIDKAIFDADPMGSLDTEVHVCNSGIVGEGLVTRRRRIGATVQATFELLRPEDDLICIHESDLITHQNVLDQLLSSGHLPIAGWPTLELEAGLPQFYDIWGFTTPKGENFNPWMRRPLKPFEVGSFGSCWIGPTSLCRGRVLDHDVVVGLCRQWRAEGVALWCDPSVEVIQPIHLWEAP